MNERVVARVAALAFWMWAFLPLASAQGFVIKPVAEKKVQQLPPGPLYWRVENFPTLADAQAAGLAGVERPRNLEAADVGPIDLRQARVADLLGAASVRRPAVVAALTGDRGGERDQEQRPEHRPPQRGIEQKIRRPEDTHSPVRSASQPHARHASRSTFLLLIFVF